MFVVKDVPANDQDRGWAGLDSLGRRILLTEILAQVSRDALRSQGLDAVLGSIVECLVQRLPVPVASIILLDAEGRHFVHEVMAGSFALDLPSAFPWPVTVGAAGRCVRTAAPVLIADVAIDPDYVSGHPAVQSEYLVPIRHADRVHGVLNLESTRSDLFTPEFCAVFDAIAEQIAGAIHLALVVRELEAAKLRLEQLSMSDGLTGIANRRRFDQMLSQQWARARDGAVALALVLVDIDCFKSLNDACGHLYADECLRELARQCQAIAHGEGDAVARYGNEEIAVLLPGRGLQDAQSLAERLCDSVSAVRMNHPASPIAAHVTVSVGVGACEPVREPESDRLVQVAAEALYQAKTLGRNRIVARLV